MNVFLCDWYYYCWCADFSGPLNNCEHDGYCFVCRIREHYCSYELVRIKYEPNKLIRFAIEIFADVNLCYEYDKTSVFWDKDYEYKWRLSSEETRGILLKDWLFSLFFQNKQNAY